MFTRLRFVDRQFATLEFAAIETINRLIATVGHFNETETAGSSRIAVGNDLGAGHVAKPTKDFVEVIRGGSEGQVADVQVLTHETLSDGLAAHTLEKTHWASYQWPQSAMCVKALLPLTDLMTLARILNRRLYGRQTDA